MRISMAVGLLLALCASAPAAPDGARLYQRHCAACHGDEGTGGVGVPLALPDFQRGVSDEYLRRSIRLGRPGRVMPAFGQLSDAEVQAIVRYIRSWAPGAPPPHDARPVAGDAGRGAGLYARHCASCHGERGQGGPGTGVTFSRPRELPIIAPALNNPGFLAAASDRLIKHALMHGREGTPMRSFLEQGLTERDIDDLVSYVRAFQNNPLPEAERPLETDQATLVMESSADLETTVENIKRAAIGKNYRIIRTQYLDQGLVAEGQENTRQVIVHFCNFQQLNEALLIDPRVGLFLPCRVTAVQHGDRVLVMTINPKRLSALFNNAELNRLCTDMYDTYMAILEEATL